jgi:hypothetical protein
MTDFAEPGPAGPASPVPSSVATAAALEISNRTHSTLGGTWKIDWRVYACCALLAVALLAWPAMDGWHHLQFASVSIPGVFGSMMLVALFVERAIEVFVAVWIDRDSAVHEQNLAFWQGRQARLTRELQALIGEREGQPPPDAARLSVIDAALVKKRAWIDEAVKYSDVEEKALLPFEARTKKVSTWVGLVLGMLASAVGFRFLGQFVTMPPVGETLGVFEGSRQYQAFVAADVLLTGVVLAGGSKLIHDIFSVYSSFMDSTKKNLQDQNK